MPRVLLATFVSAAVAVLFVALVAVLFWPDDSEKPLEVAVHFLVFGSLVVFPVAFIGGVPLYYLFRWCGWLSPGSVLVAGVVLGLAIPVAVFIDNRETFVSFWHILICTVAAALASAAFVKIARVTYEEGQL
jgi:hypothetical protein